MKLPEAGEPGFLVELEQMSAAHGWRSKFPSPHEFSWASGTNGDSERPRDGRECRIKTWSIVSEGGRKVMTCLRPTKEDRRI